MPIVLANTQCPNFEAIKESFNTHGFFWGVAFSFLVFLLCWIFDFVRRRRKADQFIRAIDESSGSELALTYKAIRAHVDLLIYREYPQLTLRGVDIKNIGNTQQKSIRLHLIATEMLNLAEVRQSICQRLAHTFSVTLGLGDKVGVIHVNIDDFKPQDKPNQASDSQDAKPAAASTPPVEKDTASLKVPPKES
ncbi:MAG: hypothetical protein GX561_02355 [Lentisphaerae bacterium]|jgi:cbb3-type cytochrome oxidase subunit 3|nr:hypothetical protein [Lentisphaerota bacterium]